MTTINYSRRFGQAQARRGDIVEVEFLIYFTSPPGPSVNCWWDNVADNLGGSQSATGPLIWNSSKYVTGQNLIPNNVSYHSRGVGGSAGCFRFWANGTVYPSPTTPLTQVWKPINPSTFTTVRLVQTFRVHDNAVIGTVIGVPTRATPCSDTNYDANKMMIDLGSEMNLIILSNTPESGSRTLTIIE